MKFGINTVDDFNIKGKTVLLRVDINQPVDKQKNELKDVTRIKGCVPTITELAKKGAKLVILAHQGSDIEYGNYYNLGLHAKALSEFAGIPVEYVPDVCGPYAQEKVRALQEGDILLLDNVRFMAEEMTLFETKLKLTRRQQVKTQVVEKLAPLADLFVMDAFAAAHRAQPTLTAFGELMPAAMGRLFEKEYGVLAEILQAPKKPLVFVLGGAKIQDAFLMMDKALAEGTADKVLAGGLVGNVMLAAKGIDIGKASLDFILRNNLGEYIEKSTRLLEKYSGKIISPLDLAYEDSVRHNVSIEQLPLNELFTDIGERTANVFAQEIKNAKTVFVNGPMGVFEKPLSEYGTRQVWKALAETKAFTVLGGGDSVAATNKYSLAYKMGYICTGGGAMVRFLSGEELPVIDALKHAAVKFGNER
ncbi:MAG: phosphoglycerate kinase [Christensenellales bacterium]